MKTLKLIILPTLCLCLLTACSVNQAEEEITKENIALEDLLLENKAGNAAATDRQTFSVPAPPAPVSAACLGIDDLKLDGTWTGWVQIAQTSNGHVHITEYIDYSEVTITSMSTGLSWTAAAGAHENIILNLPATGDDLGDSAFNVKHQFNARFLGPEGYQNLLVSHSFKQLLGPDLELRHNEFVPFSAKCIGGR